MELIWTDYMKYRAKLRAFDLTKLENIVRSSTERYWDEATQRAVMVGRHDKLLLLIPYEKSGHVVTPVTVHAITRQQINFRLKTGRFRYE